MIGTAVTKTMGDKEDGEGGAKYVDHPDHKIKLNTSSHPLSNQCWKGCQSWIWTNQNGSIAADSKIKWSAAAKHFERSTFIFFLLLCWMQVDSRTDFNIGLATVNCDQCALWTVNLNVCWTIKGRCCYFTTWADNCYTGPAVWIRRYKFQFSLSSEINFCQIFLQWSGLVHGTTVRLSTPN